VSARRRRTLEEFPPEQRAAIERIRARNRSAEQRAEDERVRSLVRAEFPPLETDPALAEALARLRLERQRQGLSLNDLAERTKLDRATISKLETGKFANPTVATLRRYARALGKQLAWSLEDLPEPARPD
jgi:ribosome-binding protein aMBF1 (putative translation factor)